MNILVVDDEPVVCESMHMLLKLDGHQMDRAYSGMSAVGQSVPPPVEMKGLKVYHLESGQKAAH
jgi:DNA-binding response OmpR family regulator